jgi:hypothetical protein
MNDRMGFVKHLFNNNQDFNRVMSQFNTISSYEEAQNQSIHDQARLQQLGRKGKL